MFLSIFVEDGIVSQGQKLGHPCQGNDIMGCFIFFTFINIHCKKNKVPQQEGQVWIAA